MSRVAPSDERSRVHFGPAGWAYPDWRERVYPPGVPTQGPRALRWLADYVDLVEVNASFYGPIDPAVARSWLAAIEEVPDFRFVVKVWQRLTHDGEPPSDAELDVWVEGVRPLIGAGRLLTLLVQFPFSFREGRAARDRVDAITARLPDVPVAVEFRHASWAVPEVRDWLVHREHSWVDIDQPALRDCLKATGWVTGPFAYLRLHGRNAGAWFAEDSDRNVRYDWRYAPAEIEELTERIRRREDASKPLLIVGNNHFHGKAVAAVLALVSELKGEPVTFPDAVLGADERLLRWHQPGAGSLF